MLEKLRQQNKALLIKYSNEDSRQELIEQRIIQELLKSDDCFRNLTVEEACMILHDLGVEDWKSAYAELLSA